MDSTKKSEVDQKVDVNFESHPPIENDLDGITALLRQTFLQFADCNSLANYLIQLKNVTQVIALGASEEEDTNDDDDDDDEPDNDIYGVSSVINLSTNDSDDKGQIEAKKHLTKFLKDKCSDLKHLMQDSSCVDDNIGKVKICCIVNERYINLPPQLALPTLKNLTQHIDDSHFTHLIFVSKILLRSRNTNTKMPSKKSKTGESSGKANAEPIIFVNPEEEIIYENSLHHADIDVSSYCDENATWSFSSDIKYIPHRRILVVDKEKWPSIIKNLEKELD